MFRLRKLTKRAVSVGLGACALLLAGAYAGGGEASPMMATATAPSLGTAASFGVLAGSAITNTGATVIDGGIGSYPTTTITGFPPGTVNGTNHAGDGMTQAAKTDLLSAYDNSAGQTPVIVPTELGGTTLTPGVYKSAAGTFGITGTLTLSGDANAVWIFQMDSTLTTASGSSVVLAGGASNCNVFWQVRSSATLGTNSTFVGNILALTSITLTTGASVSGRALARNGAVTLDSNKVSSVCVNSVTAAAVPPTATATRSATAPADDRGPSSPPITQPVPAPGGERGPASPPITQPVPAPGGERGPASSPTSAPVPTSTPVLVSTSVPAVPTTPIQAAAVPATAQPVPTSTPVPAVVLAPVTATEEAVVPAPVPAMPVALPNTGDAGSPSYGWWMVAGLILSIAAYFFRRASRRL